MDISASNIIKISNNLSNRIGRPLSDLENISLINKIRQEMTLDFKSHKPSSIITELTNRLYNSMFDPNNTPIEDIDINDWQLEEINKYGKSQELTLNFTNQPVRINKKIDREFTTLVKRELKVNTLFNLNDLFNIQRLVAPKAQYKHVHILLDTNNASDELSSGTKYGWNVSNNTLLKSGTVNAVGALQNLVGMRIHPMTTELISSPSEIFTESTDPAITNPGLLPPGYYNDFVNLNNNFTVLIEEFSAQAFVGRNGRKFHFSLFPYLMNPSTKEDYGSWTPINPYFEFVTSGNGDGWFWFNTPITNFSTLTVSMANPFKEFTLSEQTRTLIPLELIFLTNSDE